MIRIAKIYIFLILPAVVFINGSFVLAHGIVAPQDKTLHPPTQIGLPESKAGHKHMLGVEHTAIEGSLTRDQIANLIDEDQDIENFRSSIKFVILAVLIFGVITLFYPRRPSAVESLEVGPPKTT